MSSTSLVSIQAANRRGFTVAKFVSDMSKAGADAAAFMAEAKASLGKDTFLPLVVSCMPGVLSSAATDADIEGALVIMLSFLNMKDREATQSVLTQLCEAVTSDASSRAELRLRLLATIFNYVDERGSLKYDVFLRLVQYATATAQLDRVRPYFARASSWAEKWDLAPAQTRHLFLVVATALNDTDNTDEAQSFRIKYLSTFEGTDDDVAEAVPLAQQAAIGYIKAPVVSQTSNLIDLRAVKALQSHDRYSKLYELLRIFSTERLDAFLAFAERNPGYGDSIGLDHDQSVRTMRLLSLCSLASEGEVVPYVAIEKTLQVPAEDVEQWTVEAMTLGLITGRLDQVKEHVVVSRWTQRVFGETEWVKLQSKLGTWRDNVAALLDAVKAARAGASV